MKTAIELAKQCELLAGNSEHGIYVMALQKFYDLAFADVREACAKICDARVMGDNNREDMEAKRCAADIRSFRASGNI